MTTPTVPVTDQRRDAETALQRAARAAAETIHVRCESFDECMTVNEIASIIYQAIRDAREI